jgi:hypothetical protein
MSGDSSGLMLGYIQEFWYSSLENCEKIYESGWSQGRYQPGTIRLRNIQQRLFVDEVVVAYLKAKFRYLHTIQASPRQMTNRTGTHSSLRADSTNTQLVCC